MCEKLAVIFPGQSSQRIGMLSALADDFKSIRETFSEVSEILGYDMWNLIQRGPIDKLNRTYYAQPAILTSSVAIWRVWVQQINQLPNMVMTGHSLGEYSALVCSGSIDLLSAVKLVKIRSMLMQQLSPHGYGLMSVIIGLNDKIVCDLCKKVELSNDQIVSPACFNAFDNIVIAGHAKSVSKVNLLCKDAGAKCTLVLPISVPSHCALMKPMKNKFQEELEKIIINIPNIPIISSIDVCIKYTPKSIRDILIRQLYTPVKWRETIQSLIDQKIVKFLEIGPGKTLTRLMKSISNNTVSISVNDSYSLLESMKICNIL